MDRIVFDQLMRACRSGSVTELRRLGLHGEAEQAERAWDTGKEYHLPQWVWVPRSISQLIERSNQQ